MKLCRFALAPRRVLVCSGFLSGRCFRSADQTIPPQHALGATEKIGGDERLSFNGQDG
jgi:hypothetical protein